MKYIVSVLITSIALFANNTMCYKNNITDISLVENEKFDGGTCDGEYSIFEMKAKNWTIQDIKISQKGDKYNLIYILKKEEIIGISSSNEIDYEKLSKIVKKDKKKEKESLSIKNGKRVYNKNCKSCHGFKGELTPQNTSLAINTLSLEDFQYNMRAYSWGDQNKGFAMVMKPYADLTTKNEINNMFNYLQSINKK